MFDICGVGAVFRFSVSGKADEQKKIRLCILQSSSHANYNVVGNLWREPFDARKYGIAVCNIVRLHQNMMRQLCAVYRATNLQL
jgi:hypothetical protein